MLRNFELYLNYRCNRACIFCFASDSRVRTNEKEIDFNRAARLLYAARREGCDSVSFLGGEPTLHGKICGIISLAKKIGYKRTSLFSNGLKLADRVFLRNLGNAGLDNIILNIPDYRKEEFEFLTSLPGGYSLFMRGLDNCLASGINLFGVAILNRINYSHMREYAEFYADKGLRILVIQYIKYQGRARPENRSNIDKLKIRVSECAAHLPEASRIFSRKGGYPFFYEHIPPCVMKNHFNRMLDFYPDFRINENFRCAHPGSAIENLENVAYKDRVKPAKCASCLFFYGCEGIERNYIDIFGAGEFRPVRKKPAFFCGKCSGEEKRKAMMSFEETVNDYAKRRKR